MPIPATSVTRSMIATEPLPSSTPSSSRLDVRAADEPAGPDDERLVQDDQAADERPLRPAGAVEAGVEALGGEDDLAVRVAQGDRDRVATAHQDALDEGLAAVGVAWAWGAVYPRRRRRPGNRDGGPSGPPHGSAKVAAEATGD